MRKRFVTLLFPSFQKRPVGMKAFELINILKHHLNYEVEIETREIIGQIKNVEIDVFDEKGPVFVVKINDE